MYVANFDIFCDICDFFFRSLKGCEDAESVHKAIMPAETFERFALCYFVAVTVLLAPSALFSYAQSKVPYDASWESIDYVILN